MNADSFDSSSLPDALGPILESFLKRLRQGELPSLKEFADRFPQHAQEIYELFPPLVEMEQAGLSVVSPPKAAGSAGKLAWASGGDDAESRLATQHAQPIPERLGDYKILREIGGGGMGIVYEAEHEALQSRMALKVMHPKLRNRADHLRWFLREARAAAALHHTNIVPVSDYGQHEGVCYYAMQFIAGHSLDKVFEDVKRLKRDVAASAARRGENGEEPHDRTSPLEPTQGNEPAVDLAVRSVSIGLLRGEFATPPPASTEALVAAAGASLEGTDAPSGDTTEAPTTAADSLPPAEAKGNGQEVPASSVLSFISGSSWSGKSSWRYQREIARIGAQVADALDYAHRRKVIHRDIKPHNILLDALGNAWITDFGLAKLKQEENQSTSQAFAGTLRYMAPERFQGKSDGRDDIYALGATLYEFLALRSVFEASDPHQLLSRIEHDLPTPLRQVDRQIHPDLAAIIARTLAKDPTDRYQTAAELRDELRRFIEGRPVKTRPVPTYARFWKWCKRNPWLAGANIAAAVTTTVLAIGSTIAAKVYYDYSQRLSAAVEDKGRSEIDARTKLFESQVERARAGRFSRQVGQRFDSLEALDLAARIGRGLSFPPERFDRLRDEAIACMALPDMRPAGPPIRAPEGTAVFAFDEGMTRYAIRLLGGTVLVRRMSDDQEIARFTAKGDREIWVFVFSPDGRYLASEDPPSRSVTVWDVDRGRLCLRDPGPVSNSAAAFSPDSRQVDLARDDGSLRVYDLKSGQPFKNWHGPGPAQHLAFRPDGKQIAIVYQGSSPTCRILDADTGQQTRTIPLPAVGSVAWSPDGMTLAITSGVDPSRIFLWDAATGQLRAILEGATNILHPAAIHPYGTVLATNGFEGLLRLWDAILGRQILSLTCAGDPPQFSRDGRILVRRGNEFSPWQVDPALEYRTLVHASNPPLNYGGASIQPDGRILAAGTDRGVVLWDLARGTELAFLPIGLAWHSIFDVSGDLLTNGSAGVLRWPIRLDSKSSELRIGPPRKLPLPGTDCPIAEDRTGRIVAVAGHGEAYVALAERTIRIGPLDDCRGVSVSPDGQWLATSSHAGAGGQIWRIRDTTKVKDFPVSGGQFSPDGKWLIQGAWPCRLWEVGTWREIRQFDGESPNFSPDGRLAAVRDTSRVLRLVEIETGRILARLDSPDQHTAGWPTFSPDGSRLVVTTHEPPCAHVWDLRAIRRRLAGMGLDWEAPPLPDPGNPQDGPLLKAEVDYGPLTTFVEQYNSHIEQHTVPAEELIARYTERLRAHPDDPDSLHQRGHALLRSGRFEEALADFAGASARRPLDAHLRAYRGVCLFSLRRYALALDQLEASFQADPETVRAISNLQPLVNNRAWELATGAGPRRDPALAARLATFAVALSPDESISLNTLGVSLYRAGSFAKAIEALEKSLAAEHGQFDAFDLFFLAMAHHRLGHHEEAKRCFDRAVDWLREQKNLAAQQAHELAAFRAEAQSVLAGPTGEMPDDVFEGPGS